MFLFAYSEFNLVLFLSKLHCCLIFFSGLLQSFVLSFSGLARLLRLSLRFQAAVVFFRFVRFLMLLLPFGLPSELSSLVFSFKAALLFSFQGPTEKEGFEPSRRY